jgi:hypothetical protein
MPARTRLICHRDSGQCDESWLCANRNVSSVTHFCSYFSHDVSLQRETNLHPTFSKYLTVWAMAFLKCQAHESHFCLFLARGYGHFTRSAKVPKLLGLWGVPTLLQKHSFSPTRWRSHASEFGRASEVIGYAGELASGWKLRFGFAKTRVVILGIPNPGISGSGSDAAQSRSLFPNQHGSPVYFR